MSPDQFPRSKMGPLVMEALDKTVDETDKFCAVGALISLLSPSFSQRFVESKGVQTLVATLKAYHTNVLLGERIAFALNKIFHHVQVSEEEKQRVLAELRDLDNLAVKAIKASLQ